MVLVIKTLIASILMEDSSVSAVQGFFRVGVFVSKSMNVKGLSLRRLKVDYRNAKLVYAHQLKPVFIETSQVTQAGKTKRPWYVPVRKETARK